MIKFKCANYCNATKYIKKGEKIPVCCEKEMMEVKKNEYAPDMDCGCKSCETCN